MSFEILDKEGYYLLEFSDKADLAILFESFTALLNKQDFNREWHTVWDFSTAIVELSIPDIQKLADNVGLSSKQRSSRARAAFITTDPTDQTVLENYITATARYPVEFKIFRDTQTAKLWLFD